MIEQIGVKRKARARHLRLITPDDPAERGCQLSLQVLSSAPQAAGEPAFTMKRLEELLDGKGATTDTREPDVIRVAPAPLYNSYFDVAQFVQALDEALG